MKIKIQAVLSGKVTHLTGDFKTGIRNHSQDHLFINRDKIEGDEVHNQKYHGGEMRVIHHYSEVHYQYLKETFPEIADRFEPGSFGENLYTHELTEDDLCIGDIFTLGTAKIQLTASRRPCSTINLSYEDPRILKEIIKTGRTGWFYQVLQEGKVVPGDYLELIERPYPMLHLKKLFDEGYLQKDERDFAFLKACLETDLMEKGWRPALLRILSKEATSL